MNRICTCLLLILLTAPALLAQDGFRFDTPEISVVFPESPSETRRSSSKATLRMLTSPDLNGTALLLINEYVGTPPALLPGQQLRTFYTNHVAGSVRGSKGTLLSQRDLTVGDLPAKEYFLRQNYQGQLSTSKNWLLQIGDRLYTLKYIYADSSRATLDARERYFSSFRIKPPSEVASAQKAPFKWGRLFIAAPLVLALIWWLMQRRRKPVVEREETNEIDQDRPPVV
jgi:hypothetical protein